MTISSTLLVAQTFERFNLKVVENGNDLSLAMVGGLNAPQYSAVDLNNNGTLDLLIFDRRGNVVLPFINNGTPNETDYTFAPQYINNFPDLYEWVALRDYDCDGVMDIFSYSANIGIDGIVVFKGYYENDEIKFEPIIFSDWIANILSYELSNGTRTQIYVSKEDYPAFDDIDGDGDLDILTFSVGGGYVLYYQNQSVELGYEKDSLIYDLVDNCWGGFYESGLSEAISLSIDANECSSGFQGGAEIRHAGSTLLTLDNDADGDKELLLGDISFTNITMLMNGGNTDNAWMTVQDTFFPSYNLPVDLPIFPSAFYIDMDNDNVKDLVVSPNNGAIAENVKNVWFYRNSGANNMPVFNFVQNDKFTVDMVDFGSGANPAFADVTGDGLTDMLIGNFSFYQEQGMKDARLFLYENTGTITNPEFTLIDDDFLELNQFGNNAYDFAPSFGDIDNDGDDDLFIGIHTGAVFFAENTAGAGNPMTFASVNTGYMGIDIGQHAVPTVVDLNGDQLADLVIGERNGNLNYIQNIGSIGNPMFNPDQDVAPNTSFLGSVDTREPGYTTGYTAPVFIRDEFGTLTLYAGSEIGRIKKYTNIEGNLYGEFTLENDDWGDLKMGWIVRPAFANLNGNDKLEMTVGNFRGGISGYNTDIDTDPLVSTTVASTMSFSIAPNPAQELISIRIQGAIEPNLTVNIYNTLGQLVYETNLYSQSRTIRLDDFSNGLYLCEITNGNEKMIEKFVVEK